MTVKFLHYSNIRYSNISIFLAIFEKMKDPDLVNLRPDTKLFIFDFLFLCLLLGFLPLSSDPDPGWAPGSYIEYGAIKNVSNIATYKRV